VSRHKNRQKITEGTNMSELDLEKLSNDEIKKLWKQTTDRARRIQTERRENAIHEPMQDEGYHKDAWGNLVEGPAPKRKENRYYIDSSGWVVELAEGQEAPQTSGNSLVDWINTVDVSHDPEVREALGQNNLFLGAIDNCWRKRGSSDGKIRNEGLVDRYGERKRKA
jgi:hypothetical protein